MKSSYATLPAAAAGQITLGDLAVNRLGFGAMRITGRGVWGQPPDRANALAVLRRAVELGCNLIDTADSYGPNVSEELVAEALAPYPADVVIATKGGWTRPGPDDWRADASPAHLRDALEGSLRRLRLERIDLYQLHCVDPNVRFEDSVAALAALQRAGKIRHIGLSNVNVDQIERARAIVPIVSVQNRYNIATAGSAVHNGVRDDEADAIVDYCTREGLAFLPWGPLGEGTLSPQKAIAWLLRRSPAMLPIPGTSSLAHLDENVAAAALTLSDEEFAARGR